MREIIIPIGDDECTRKIERVYGIKGELIRCKDCKSRSEVSYKCIFGENLYRCYVHECFVMDGDFCSFGEKK